MRQRIVQAVAALTVAAVSVLGVLRPGDSATAAPLAATGYEAKSPEYGMSVFLYGNSSTTARDLKKLTDVKFGWQKSLFRWRDLEGDCKGCYTWEETDRVVKESEKAGLKIIARLDFQPKWARKDGAHNGPPDNYQDFADFVTAFVTRYKSGSPHGTVQAIEVWNEVNLQREWGTPINQQAAADYVRMLSTAYKAAKEADPTVTVVTAGLSPTGWNDDTARPDDDYLNWMYAAGLKGGVNYDVMGVNGNVQCPSVEAAPGACPVMADRMGHGSFYFRRIEQLRDIMVANGDGAHQVWLMEFGWTTDTVNSAYSWYATTDQIKADLIVRAFQYASQNWAPWIGVMTLWTLSDPHWGPQDEQVYWAVTNPDGSVRPAYERLIKASKANELPNLGQGGTVTANQPAVTGPTPPEPASIAVPAGAQPAPPAGEVLRVIDTGVNMRQNPSTSATVLKVLTTGDKVTANGAPRDADGYTWRNVRDAAGTEGWVAVQFLAP